MTSTPPIRTDLAELAELGVNPAALPPQATVIATRMPPRDTRPEPDDRDAREHRALATRDRVERGRAVVIDMGDYTLQVPYTELHRALNEGDMAFLGDGFPRVRKSSYPRTSRGWWRTRAPREAAWLTLPGSSVGSITAAAASPVDGLIVAAFAAAVVLIGRCVTHESRTTDQVASRFVKHLDAARKHAATALEHTPETERGPVRDAVERVLEHQHQLAVAGTRYERQLLSLLGLRNEVLWSEWQMTHSRIGEARLGARTRQGHALRNLLDDHVVEVYRSRQWLEDLAEAAETSTLDRSRFAAAHGLDDVAVLSLDVAEMSERIKVLQAESAAIRELVA